MGLCKRCRVKIIKRNGKEDVLACQLKVEGNLVVEISNEEAYYNINKGIEQWW